MHSIPQPDALRRTPSPESSPNPLLQVVLFSGGSGTRSICETLIRQPRIALTVLINAYDDGHSTGRVRRFVPGILGPSDVRKNLDRLMPQREGCHRALRAFSDCRLPAGSTFAEGNRIVAAMAERKYGILPPVIQRSVQGLTIAQADQLSEWFSEFSSYSNLQAAAGRYFDFHDCALGNILFAGCFLANGSDFNRTVATLSAFYEIRGTLLNITEGENLFLAARKDDGTFLPGEAEIVAAQSSSMISELLLIDGDVYLNFIDRKEMLAPGELERALAEGRRLPRINPAAAAALASADVVIYGPGTQHSSLFPSYLTRGVAEAIVENKTADKIFVCNIRRDFDLPQEDGAAIVQKFLNCMRRNGETTVDRAGLVTTFLFQTPEVSYNSGPEYIPFDPTKSDLPPVAIRLSNWESESGQHSGGQVVNEIQKTVNARIDRALRPVRQLVSIVIPVLNEAPTIERALRSLTSLDFSQFELSVEFLCVDGGSSDGSLELASAVPGVKVLSSPSGKGRGTALRAGIDQARGDIIAFYPADLEYRAEDIFRIVLAIVNDDYKAVFGTRNVKCTNLSQRLAHIYGDATGLYLMSKYGGMLLSVSTLFLYNRYVTDPLTSVMAFDAHTLRSLGLRASSVDILTEIIASLCRKDEFILEIPVDYKPRTRAQGKKTRPLDGALAILSLLRGKFRSRA